MKRQRGVTLSGLLATLVVIGVIAITAMRIVPAYIEYYSIKQALVAMRNAQQLDAAPSEIRSAFQRRIEVENISSVTPADLKIVPVQGGNAVSVSYGKKVPLFGQISLYFDFSASSHE